jgi:FkbM family methyltransferase
MKSLMGVAKKFTWLTSQPEFHAHPLNVSLRLLQWEWRRIRGTPVVLPLYNFRIEARPSDGMGRLLFYFREHADHLFGFMQTYLKPGMTFVDVGANIGSHTLHGSSLVGNDGKVLSFEADPSTFALLEENVRSNGVENATLLNQCISDKRGEVRFNVDANSARSSLVRKGSSQVVLLANCLDDLIPYGVHIDLLKLDVEGAEYLVLKGATQIFRTAPPRVVVCEATSCLNEITDFLSSFGYRFYRFQQSDATLIEVESPVFNTYAIRDVSLPELSEFRFRRLDEPA